MKNGLNIPVPIVALFLSAWLGLQGWSLLEVSRLQERVAALTVKIEMHIQTAKANEHLVVK